MSKAPKLRFKEFSGDWESIKVDKVFSHVRNGFVGTATPYYVEKGIPYLQSNNIRKNKIDKRKIVYINEEFHKKNEKSILKKGDILMVQSGHAGECAVVTEEFENANCHALIVMTPNKNINSTYCSYYINSDIGQKRIYKLITGNTIKHILASEMKEFNIIKPELEEQEKIASFFSLIDEKIALQEQKVEALKDYKTGMMQKIFGRELRFKDENGRDYPEWKEKKLEKVIDEYSNKTTENNQYPVLSSTLGGITLQDEYFLKQTASSDTSGYKIVPRGYFTYRSMSDTGIFRFNLQNIVDLGIVSPAYPVFLANEKMNTKFLEIALNNSSKIKRQLLVAKEGGTRYALGFSKLKNLKIDIPCKDEQDKIAKLINNIDKKIEKEQEKLNSLNEYKKGLLQQMFV